MPRARILVVSPDGDFLRIYDAALTHVGHEVLPARNAVDALAIVDAERLDLAVVNFPTVTADGRFLTEVLHGRRETMGRIVAITAWATPADVERARRCGAVSVVTMPARLSDVMREIESVLLRLAP